MTKTTDDRLAALAPSDQALLIELRKRRDAHQQTSAPVTPAQDVDPDMLWPIRTMGL